MKTQKDLIMKKKKFIHKQPQVKVHFTQHNGFSYSGYFTAKEIKDRITWWVRDYKEIVIGEQL